MGPSHSPTPLRDGKQRGARNGFLHSFVARRAPFGAGRAYAATPRTGDRGCRALGRADGELGRRSARAPQSGYDVLVSITGERRCATIGAMETRRLTALIEKSGDLYVALCPEVDVASQGDTVEEARTNLIEALQLFFETASPDEIASRLSLEVFVTSVEVPIGKVA